MGRSNVIIIGSVVLAPLILGVESYALYRAHHRRVQTAETTRPTEMTAAQVLRAPVAAKPVVPLSAERPLPPPPLPPPPLPPPPPAPLAAENSPAETETFSDVQTDPTVERRHQLMVQRRGEVLLAADEQVFGTLHLPDEQRAAIRALDGAYARTVQAIAKLPPGTDLQGAGLDLNADQTRRAAIAGILGPEATQAFNFAERKAERRVRDQYRVEQVRGR